MPDRFVHVIRHAQSLEDVDKTLYERIADKDMPLSDDGRVQAAECAQELRKRLVPSTARFHLSPSRRVLETADIVMGQLAPDVFCQKRVDWLLTKQDWGNVTPANRSEIERERYRAGVLRYQFPDGESGPRMVSRFRRFGDKLKRQMTSPQAPHNAVIIIHGFEFRVLLMALLGWTEEYFESLAHPHNCEIKSLRVLPAGEFELLDAMRAYDPSSNPKFIRRQ